MVFCDFLGAGVCESTHEQEGEGAVEQPRNVYQQAWALLLLLFANVTSDFWEGLVFALRSVFRNLKMAQLYWKVVNKTLPG